MTSFSTGKLCLGLLKESSIEKFLIYSLKLEGVCCTQTYGLQNGTDLFCERHQQVVSYFVNITEYTYID